MTTNNARDMRLMTGLADMMPALRTFALTVDALAIDDAGQDALYTAVTQLYRAGYDAGRRAQAPSRHAIEEQR